MSRRIRVTGHVQGVWYRGWTVDQARSLGLDGWVRNRRDGTVELLVSGPDEKVEALIARCHDGPPAARVDQVEAVETDEPVPSGFSQRPTA